MTTTSSILRRLPAIAVSMLFWAGLYSGSSSSGQAVAAKPATKAVASAAGPETLLTKSPFDRISLTDGSEVEVEPLAPRPLPAARKSPFNRVARRQRTPEEEAKIKEVEKDPAIRITVQPVEADGAEYLLYREDIKSILYFEDMLLLEANRLIAISDFAKAFEYLLLVHGRDPKWNGLVDSYLSLLMAEARQRFDASDHSAGLQYITEVLVKKPGDSEAKRLAIKGLEQLAAADLTNSRFERLREVQQRMQNIDKSAAAIGTLSAKLQTVATQRLATASADGPERLDQLNEAYRAWPETPGLSEALAEAQKRWPTVRVAVRESIQQPSRVWGVSKPNQRATKLGFLPLLADLQEDSFKGRSAHQLLERFEMSDLTTASLILKPGQKWSNGRAINSRDVVAALSSWALPSSPAYNGVWASLVDSVSASDERKIQVKFTRPIFQPESWFLRPIGPAETSQAEKISAAAWIGSGAYRWAGQRVESLGPESIFERIGDQTSGLFRIRELIFDDDLDGWQALLDGRVDVLEHLPTFLTAEKSPSDQVAIASYSVPEIHMLALDGRQELLANRSLRRALGYALNRAEVLEEQFLGRPPTAEEFVADGPFPKGSAWDDPETKSQPADPAMAALLFASARREMKVERIKLTLDHPRRPDINRSVAKIADLLRGYGLDITLKSWSASELEERLASGQPFQMAWRFVSPSTNHFEIGGWISPSLYAPPSANGLAALASPLALSQVLDVERTWNENLVRQSGRFIDRLCREEVPLIPLWQVPRRFAWRKSVTGLKPGLDGIYQNIHDWSVASEVKVKKP
ncbi:MAG: ABC transporter substrate-binding protein [Planctomycetota bacterium]